MLHIYLSDRAIHDLKLYANVAEDCLAALKEAITQFQSINELLIATREHRKHSIKRLKCKPTAWRHRSGDFRCIFTAITSVENINFDSIQILRVAPRSKVYEGLERYLEICDEVLQEWQNPNGNEENLLEETLSEEDDRAIDSFEKDRIYLKRSCLQIHQLKGSAGTGKTTSALRLAMEAVNNGSYPIVIVPNKELQKFCKKELNQIESNNNLKICEYFPNSQSTDLAVFTKAYLLQYLAGAEHPWIVSGGNQIIRSYLESRRVSIPKELDNIDLYSLYLGQVAASYHQSNKDPLSQEFTKAINFINEELNKRYIRESLEDRDIISQANKAIKNKKKSIEVISQLIGYSNEVNQKSPILIIDEVQDFYWSELQALINFYLVRFPMTERYETTAKYFDNELKKTSISVANDAGRLIILAGDNNQRVTFSGFSWSNFVNTFRDKFPNCDPPIAPDVFNKNHRNTKQITRAANYILSAQGTNLKAFKISTDGNNWIDTPPSQEFSKNGNTTPRLIKADREWIDQLISQLRDGSKVRPMESSDRFVFIYDEASYIYQDSQEQDNLLFLNVAEAKGREFDAVVIIFPFAICSEQPTISQLFKWYTSLTRARNYAALLISDREWDWLHKMVINSSDLETVFAKSSSLSIDDFVKDLYAEGRSSLTREEEISLLVDNIFRRIEHSLQSNSNSQNLIYELRQKNLEIWEILDAIADREHQFSPSLRINPNLSLENYSPEEALITYIAILPLLVEIQFNNIVTVDLEVVSKLEQYFKQDQEQFQLAESEVLNPISLCLIHRANQDSWTAAAKLKPIAQSSISKFLFNQIAEDLVRRGLSWHTQKFRHQFLGEEPDNNLPYPELVKNSEGKYIPRLLLEIVDSNVLSFNS